MVFNDTQQRSRTACQDRRVESRRAQDIAVINRAEQPAAHPQHVLGGADAGLTAQQGYSAYDRLAQVYNRAWGGNSTEQALPALDRLILRQIPPDAQILDLCCGTGQLVRALLARDYRVTGLDGSEQMLRWARVNAPGGAFILADARSFRTTEIHDLVVSTFNSLNHLMDLDELATVFHNVRAALRPHGWFFFEMTLEEGFRARWRGSYGMVEDDYARVVRPSYDPERREARDELTLFYADNGWQRVDLTLTQRCHSEAEIRSALEGAGFSDIHRYDAQQDLGIGREAGRAFFVARAHANPPMPTSSSVL